MAVVVGGIKVDPVGLSCLVNITEAPSGATATAYTAIATPETSPPWQSSGSVVSFPTTISTPTTLYITTNGPCNVSIQYAGQEVSTDTGAIAQTPEGGGEVFTIAASMAPKNLAKIAAGAINAVAPPTGVAATDTAALQAAVNAASAAGAGLVQLQAGTYAVSSVGRVATTVSNSGPSTTWTDSSAVAADLGGYVLSAASANGYIPQITAVTPGTGYTTDVAPRAAQTSVAAWIIHPGVLIPPGVTIQGAGGVVGLGTGNFFDGSGSPSGAKFGTRILDSGSGITLLSRGSNSLGAYVRFRDLAVWGGAGSMGSALGGIYIANNMWFSGGEHVDIQWYNNFCLAYDGNLNSSWWQSCTFQHVSALGGSAMTGGVLWPLFGASASAALNLANCFVFDVYGVGIGGFISGQIGTIANCYGCQVDNVFKQTSSQAQSVGIDGVGYVFSGSSGTCGLFASYGTTNGRADIYNWTNSNLVIAGGQYTTGGINFGFVSSQAVFYNKGSGNFWTQSAGQQTWSGCYSTGCGLYSGGPTAAAMAGAGSSLSNVIGSNAVTVTTNAGTCPVTTSLDTFTNSSAATMTITLATTGAMDGQMKTVRVYDFSAVAETITWVNTENGEGTAPTTSNGSTTLPKTVVFQFNAATTKWRCIIS